MKQCTIKSKRCKVDKLKKDYPGAIIIDVTSKAELPWLKFSPFYPHGNIPIPFTENETGESVEGIWQGLKVFSKEGIDPSKFHIKNMKSIKRSVRRLGSVLGHQKGLESTHLLSYLEARKQIYIPVYLWVLENILVEEIEGLRSLLKDNHIVLLDYETNSDVEDLRRPLSHASLIRSSLEK